ncbi:sugar transferase [Priestia aryabhattai]|uniref:sugar transferase n=1 Tax=Priestia aryabhattai TaxID=412384 RepID=UPI00211BBA3C|nr:sugar transferase [Priestia aryabhattai]MCQ9281081.1 sugar transferase [Priestia aryabhattai]MED4153855.1 sugar transferase [Priestia aryabhattai]
MQQTQVVQKKVQPNNQAGYLLAKRCTDIAGAIVGLLVLFVVFLIVGLLIKLEDPKGSIFFSQKRVGKNGEEFNMYKFRSMVSDAEAKLAELLEKNEATGAMFKMKNDPRVTKIGRFIRKTSIDELPQLINVLKGDMSLVGPRPPLVREVNEYTEYQMQRLLVTPGCTGLWQVSGRSNVGFEEMVELDLTYISTRSLTTDIKIICRTIFMLFGSKNAY